MWKVPRDLLAAGNSAEPIAYVLDQLTNPQDFLAKIEELSTRPESESTDTLEFKDGRIFERYSRPQLVDGVVLGRVWSFRDVTERTRLEAELAHQAFHDPLTGLANKALFRDRLIMRSLEWSPPDSNSPSSSWTWTTSRPSMTASVTPEAICCWASSPRSW